MKFLFSALILLSAVHASAYFDMNKTSVDFWDVKVGDFFGKSQFVMIYNRDRQPLNIRTSQSCSFADVEVRTAFCNRIEPGWNCEMEIKYTPRQVGRTNCTITVQDSNFWQERIYVSGNGVN
jgi:hypothetical protein